MWVLGFMNVVGLSFMCDRACGSLLRALGSPTGWFSKKKKLFWDGLLGDRFFMIRVM